MLLLRRLGAASRAAAVGPSLLRQPEAGFSPPPPWAACAGNAPLPQTRSYAQCYGGHQFGSWAGQLGDGRAICLGQAVNAAGERWELQLKVGGGRWAGGWTGNRLYSARW